MYAEVTRRGWFRESPEQQRRVWRAIGTGLVVVGLASGWFLGFRSVGTDQVGGVSLGVPSGDRAGRRAGGGRAGRAPARQADGRPHRGRQRRAGPVAGVQAVPRDRGGGPDPVRGGAGHLQPLPALRDRVRRRRPLGQGVQRRWPRRPRRRGSRWTCPPGTCSPAVASAASRASPAAWTASPPPPRAPSPPPPAPRAAAASPVAASPAAVAGAAAPASW